MKGMDVVGWKLGMASLVFLLIGVLSMLRVGSRRGTRMYGIRLALWAIAVGLLSGGAVVAGTSSASAEVSSPVPDNEVDIAASPDDSAEDTLYTSCYCTVSPPARW